MEKVFVIRISNLGTDLNFYQIFIHNLWTINQSTKSVCFHWKNLAAAQALIETFVIDLENLVSG